MKVLAGILIASVIGFIIYRSVVKSSVTPSSGADSNTKSPSNNIDWTKTDAQIASYLGLGLDQVQLLRMKTFGYTKATYPKQYLPSSETYASSPKVNSSALLADTRTVNV